jgi:hypothetical protein
MDMKNVTQALLDVLVYAATFLAVSSTGYWTVSAIFSFLVG